MLIGEYHHTMDEKGRLALPTKFRDVLSHGVIVTRGVDRCLFVYPKDTWQHLARALAGLPFNQKKARALARLMLAGAMDVLLDRQGRVMLPEYLRAYAALGRNIVIAGVYDRLEVWDARLWGQYTKRAERQSEDIAEAIGAVTTRTES